jgi:hypothetical protein
LELLCGTESNYASLPIFPLYFLKTQKLKKASRGGENDYGEENKMFLNLIFTANRNQNILLRGLIPPTLL